MKLLTILLVLLMLAPAALGASVSSSAPAKESAARVYVATQDMVAGYQHYKVTTVLIGVCAFLLSCALLWGSIALWDSPIFFMLGLLFMAVSCGVVCCNLKDCFMPELGLLRALSEGANAR